MKLINAEIIVQFKAPNVIDQESLDEWDGEESITLKEYFQFMIEEGLFFEVIRPEFELIEVLEVDTPAPHTDPAVEWEDDDNEGGME